MFKDANFFIQLRQKVIPLLKTYPSVRIWDVACSTCEDLYSMEILFHEEGLSSKCRIYATQENEKRLREMEEGYLPTTLLNQSQKQYKKAGGKDSLQDYFTVKGNRAVLREKFRTNVSFFQHNLKTDGSFNEFQIILCRGVMGRMDKAIVERAHQILFDSLCPFGVLALGAKESIHGSSLENHYKLIDSKVGLYKKVG